ncbi:unnamed protein product, partial [Echinostoma caproni]|uniref:ATPase_AAA_core domain-containing protein n=1 Tax=Echinostoma caproni TaxID=27848 RepID=A0A183BDP5_9TREM
GDFRVSIADPADPDSSGDSDREKHRGTNPARVKQSREVLRISFVLRTASENRWNTRHLVLVRGLPGSGKTTLARSLHLAVHGKQLLTAKLNSE